MAHSNTTRPPRCALHLDEVCTILGCRPSKLYEDIKTGVAPSPFRISTRAVRWDSDEVYDALDRMQAMGKQAWHDDNSPNRAPLNPKLRRTHHRKNASSTSAGENEAKERA